MTKKICKNCKWGKVVDSTSKQFYEHDGQGNNGRFIPIKEILCHRYPKRFNTSDNEFCGEFKIKKSK